MSIDAVQYPIPGLVLPISGSGAPELPFETRLDTRPYEDRLLQADIICTRHINGEISGEEFETSVRALLPEDYGPSDS